MSARAVSETPSPLRRPSSTRWPGRCVTFSLRGAITPRSRSQVDISVVPSSCSHGRSRMSRGSAIRRAPISDGAATRTMVVGRSSSASRPAPGAAAVADREVDAARRQLDDLRRRVQHQLDLGMLVAEIREARHQPAHREGRGRGDLQRAPGVGAGQLVDGAADAEEGGGERGGQPLALRRQRAAAAAARLMSGDAQAILERANLLADGGMADVERRAGAGEAAGLRQGGKARSAPSEGRFCQSIFPPPVGQGAFSMARIPVPSQGPAVESGRSRI